MTQATVYQWAHGTSAFKADGTMMMLDNEPYCSTGFRLTRVEEWLTTLEEIIPTIEPCHRYAIESLYFMLKATRIQHEKDHEEMVSEAPTAEDLQEYLSAYAAAIGNEAIS